MFTGLVESVGRVVRVRRASGGATVRMSAPFASELERGESVSVNGVCQTVVRSDASGFEVDVVRQTLSVTTIGELRGGSEVNLERALRLGDRLGGHMVAGHVDGVARVTALRRDANGARLSLELPEGLSRYVVARGSIAVDGISLTVAEVSGSHVTVALIPETLRATLAGTYRPGTRVNVEADLLAKHQEKLLRSGVEDGEPEARGESGGGLTEKRLRELGFTG
ncbi:MAG: riboflavin synthase [Candidatus Eisenbacteria bacterium]